MAWIKMRVLLHLDPKIMAMADFLTESSAFVEWMYGGQKPVTKVTKAVTKAVTIEGLRRVWGMANECAKSEFPDVVLTHTTVTILSAIAEVPMLGEAMQSVGWATQEGTSVRLPNFLKGNTLQEDRPLTNAERQLRYRERHKTVTDSVTKTVTSSNGANVTKVTPRKRDRKKERDIQGKRAFSKPTLQEVSAYCQERKNGLDPQGFLDHYESNGWRVGKNPMKDWQAAVRTWETNQMAFANGRAHSAAQVKGPVYADL